MVKNGQKRSIWSKTVNTVKYSQKRSKTIKKMLEKQTKNPLFLNHPKVSNIKKIKNKNNGKNDLRCKKSPVHPLFELRVGNMSVTEEKRTQDGRSFV